MEPQVWIAGREVHGNYNILPDPAAFERARSKRTQGTIWTDGSRLGFLKKTSLFGCSFSFSFFLRRRSFSFPFVLGGLGRRRSRGHPTMTARAGLGAGNGYTGGKAVRPARGSGRPLP